MTRGFWPAVAVVLATCGAASRPAQDNVNMLAGFTISVKQTAGTVTLHCEIGCTWRTLRVPPGTRSVRITEQGVLAAAGSGLRGHPAETAAQGPPTLGGAFRLRIDGIGGNLSVTCERGCAWARKRYDCERIAPCALQMNEYGATWAPADSARMAMRKAAAKKMVAEKRPDFSGHWLLASRVGAGSDVAEELVVRQSVSQAPPFRPLAIERHFKTGVRAETLDMEGLRSGWVAGSVTEATADANTPTSEESSTRWDGDTFVAATRTCRGPSGSVRCTDHSEAWTLEGRKTLLVTVTDQESGAPAVTMKLTYRRK